MSLAIVFPGQGSQSVGMMAGFADVPIVEQTFLEANAILGIDLWTMVREGPPEALNQTVNTQPVMLVAGVACWRAWNERGYRMPQWLAGHSLGEYSALVASGAMRFEDALPLVRSAHRRCRRRSLKESAQSRRSSASTTQRFLACSLKRRKVRCWNRRTSILPGRSSSQGIVPRWSAVWPLRSRRAPNAR